MDKDDPHGFLLLVAPQELAHLGLTVCFGRFPFLVVAQHGFPLLVAIQNQIQPVDYVLSTSVYEHLDGVEAITRALAKLTKPEETKAVQDLIASRKLTSREQDHILKGVAKAGMQALKGNNPNVFLDLVGVHLLHQPGRYRDQQCGDRHPACRQHARVHR